MIYTLLPQRVFKTRRHIPKSLAVRRLVIALFTIWYISNRVGQLSSAIIVED